MDPIRPNDNTTAAGLLPQRTISRKDAESEQDYVVRLYRWDDVLVLTYDELHQRISREVDEKGLQEQFEEPGSIHDYIVECCLVGIYTSLEAESSIKEMYTDGNRLWAKADSRRDALPPHGGASLAPQDASSSETWLDDSVVRGDLRKVSVVEYWCYEDVDEGQLVAQLLITED